MPNSPSSSAAAHTPRVFVSYSHDSSEHKAWVQRLATDLRSGGIEVVIDRWGIRPGEDAPNFMERSIREAAKVVVICTPAYVVKANSRTGGAGYESVLVTAELVQSAGTAKFIPVLRDNPERARPSFLDTRLYVDLTDDDAYEERLTELLRTLHGLPAIPLPPIGPNPFAELASIPAPAPHSINSSTATTFVEEIEELLEQPQLRIRMSKALWRELKRSREELVVSRLYEYGDTPSPELVRARVTAADVSLGRLVPAFFAAGRWASPEQFSGFSQGPAYLLDGKGPRGSFYQGLVRVAPYAAWKLCFATSLGALHAARYDNLRTMISVPVSDETDRDRPFLLALHRDSPFAWDIWKQLEGREREHTPAANHLATSLRTDLESIYPTQDAFDRAFDRVSIFLGLAYRDLKGPNAGESPWTPVDRLLWRGKSVLDDLTAELERSGDETPFLAAGFFRRDFRAALAALADIRQFIAAVRDQRGIY